MDSTKAEPYYVMGTGSRSMRTDPNAQNIFVTLCSYIIELKQEHPTLVLISGMAEGWDEAIAKAAIRFEIPFIAAVPHAGYGSYYWGRKSVTGNSRMNDWLSIIRKAEEVVK